MDLCSGGSSPSFPNMKYNSYAFLINHVNILTSTKYRWSLVRYNRKSLKLLILLRHCGVVNSSLLICKKKKLLKLSPFVYKKVPFFKGIRLISTPSKSFSIKLKALRIVSRSLGGAILVLETSKGLLTHNDALRLRIGGRLLCIIT